MNINEQENSDDELDLIPRKAVWDMLHGLGGVIEITEETIG